MINFAKDQDGLAPKYSMGTGGDWIRKELKAQEASPLVELYSEAKRNTYLKAPADRILKIFQYRFPVQNGSRRIIKGRVFGISS